MGVFYNPIPVERGAPWDAGDQPLTDMYEDNRCVILADARIERG